ncbi:MAG TPA: DUF4442 domain-containing protein [Ferruginibacter sp.]|jgi:hypothetical protein|nr:DUF4442 domain-containing protein [Ferruginibacter sp.]
MSATSFIQLVKHPLKFRLFLLSKLPAAYFSGVRVREISEERCVATVPYKWFTRNPFRSTYFACLSMAAEMSTGTLAMAHLYNRKPAVSMLVTKVESSYHKKASGRTKFTCEDGLLFAKAIQQSIDSGQPQELRVRSVGKNEAGDLIAEFYVTWSFKARL